VSLFPCLMPMLLADLPLPSATPLYCLWNGTDGTCSLEARKTTALPPSGGVGYLLPDQFQSVPDLTATRHRERLRGGLMSQCSSFFRLRQRCSPHHRGRFGFERTPLHASTERTAGPRSDLSAGAEQKPLPLPPRHHDHHATGSNRRRARD